MAWLNGYQVWLTQTQSLQNAQLIVNYLFTSDKDWSKASISAMIGNMRHESSVNPNMYEFGKTWAEDMGFGLVQWTPRSKYWNWALANGFTESQLRDGDAQLARIDYEVDNNIQWLNVSKNNGLTFKEFRTNSRGLTVDQLTEAFTWGYERPREDAGIESMPARKAFAHRAFNELNWSSTPDPDPDPDPTDPDPDPEPDPNDTPYDGINLAEFIKNLNDRITQMLTADVYHMGTSEFYKNEYLKLTEQMGNTYKIRPNETFFNEISKLFEDFNNSYIPEPEPDPNPDPNEPDPDPDPDPPGTLVKIFPVKIQNGINFWKRSNWGVGTLQRNMTYGVRSNGQNHYGYDIGGGGVKHTIYSITDGKVTQANFANGIGNRIIINNDDDQYHIQYGHLDSFLVGIGDIIKAGQPIAIMGATGGNYAIHLDVKISTTPTGFYAWDTTIDPEPYMGITRDNYTTLPKP